MGSANRPVTYLVGRHADCDVRLGDETVARFHAELVVSTDGMFFLLNRNASSGLWVYRDRKWREWSRPDYVDRDDRVRLGRYETTIGEILSQAPGGMR